MASRRIFQTTRKALGAASSRNLNIHEHMSVDLLREYGIKVPEGRVAHSAAEAKELAAQLPTNDVVVKAQVLAGGRGKGHFDNGFQGGVHVCYGTDDVEKIAEKMLGANLITKQTGAEGRPCNKVFLCERRYPRREYYCSLSMDRGTGQADSKFGPVLVASSAGGMNIEEVAEESPELIIKHHIDINTGLSHADALDVAKRTGFPEAAQADAADFFMKLYKIFCEKDCTTVEINPMTEDYDGSIMAMDAKFNFDDNAEYKHKDIFGLKDWSQEDPREAVAAEADLNYIGLDGHIGCLVNGAGLAMATMDIIKLKGGEPANFLDVGGGANAQQVEDAFKLITSDPKVRCILVNIFGGIMRCDVIATGIVNAAKNLDMKVPIVVRLQGNFVNEAKEIIASSEMKIMSNDNLDEAAQLASTMSKIMEVAKQGNVQVNFELPI
jgi:succinyl-CoA synthetase beta subunit